APVVADALARDALARALEGGLHEQRKREASGARVGNRAGEPERCGGDTVALENLLGAPLVETEPQRERIRSVIRHAEELADCGNVTLTARPEQSFGDVEYEVGPVVEQFGWEVLVGLETDHLADEVERTFYGVDRCRVVPLDVEVGLREVGAE